jgi:hypothetical protein
MNLPLLGCVLNQVTMGGEAYYGRKGKYSRYRYYNQGYYHDYYGEESHDKPS